MHGIKSIIAWHKGLKASLHGIRVTGTNAWYKGLKASLKDIRG